MALLVGIFKLFCFTNASFPDVFPGIRKMEAEIVRMLASLFHGGPKSCGSFTTSSAESILLIVEAYRNRAYKNGIRKPEIIVSEGASVAFWEAAKILGIRIVKLRVRKDTYDADIAAIKRAITRETCLIVASAPSPIFGTVDQIEDISQLALRYAVPLHVEASFLLPFMEQCDFTSPPFDFRVSGITSITVDLDKYGFCPVQSSIVLWRDAEYLESQAFMDTEWPGGIYVSPTVSDNRSGSQIALTWATMLYHGRHGYVEKTQQILDSSRDLLIKLKKEFDGIIQILGDPILSIITFTTTPHSKIPVHLLGDELNELGWNLTLQQSPDSLRICVCMNQTKDTVIDEFVSDIKKCVKKITALMEESNKVYERTITLYGLSSSFDVGYSMKDALSKLYLEAYYATPSATNRAMRTLSIEGRKLSQIMSHSRLVSLSLPNKEHLLPPKEE